MLVNNQLAAGEYRHNYIRLAFLVGTLLLFIGYVTVFQIFDRGNNHFVSGNRTMNRTRFNISHDSDFVSGNRTIRAEDLLINDINPSDWVYRSLSAFNYLWQLAWLFYSLTFIYRRSSTGYLYLSPNTLTPVFYIIYILAFLIPTFWLVFFQKKYLIWTWIVYLVSFLLLSIDLFIVNNNLALNKKLYETEGFNRDIWCLRFFAQNGVAFFACWTAIRFVLAFDTFLQVRLALSIANAGTIALVIIAVIAAAYFFAPNLNAALVEKCAYQFAPWVVFIIFFWGVIENNWVPKHVSRNNIIAAIELFASVVSAIGAMALFTMRYRASKIDPIA